MNRLDQRSLTRLRAWPQAETLRALASLDEEARQCGAALDAEALNFILRRLPRNDFLNRYKREIALKRKAFKLQLPEIYPNLPDVVRRSVDHWGERVSSLMEDAQDEARLFERALRLRNVYVWLLVGREIRRLNSGLEGVFWKVRTEGFRRMSLSERA